MRIGITGTHGTGKTTLLNALREQEQFKHYAFCNEVTRWVKGLGFDINEQGNDSTQILINMKHIYNVFMNRHMITDRIILDAIVYSKYLLEEGMISEETYYETGKVWLNLMPYYDVIFYLKPEFAIEDDGVRSVNTHFQTRIHELFERAIEKYEIPVIHISGSVEERVQQILRYTND